MPFIKGLILSICFLFCFVLFSMAQEVKYGLEFKSHEVEKGNRTGLDLTPEKPFHFPGGFSITFEAMFHRKSQQIFGYILRIIGNNNQNIDLVLASEYDIYPNIIVTTSKAESLLNYKFEDFGNTYDEWLPISITFKIEESLLIISIGNKKYSFAISNANDFKNVNIVFGKNDYLKSPIRDVPPMVIKEILIKDSEEKPIYHWSLSKHVTGGVYDELKKHFASCSNPLWILDKHTSWEKLLTFNTRSNPQICYNEKENDIAIADAIDFYTFNTNTGILKKDSLTKGQPHGNLMNQLIYDPVRNKYCSYSFEKKASYYDSIKKSWDNNAPDFELYHWHHNRYLYPGDSCLYLFFGYGHHKYSNEIFRYNPKNNSLESINFKGNIPPPRYLSGLGKIDDDRILLFGGYGSTTGNQEFFPKNYYDCYIINLKTKEIKKLWELNVTDRNFVVANSVVVDTTKHCFYALCFPQQEFSTYLQLCRFSMEKPQYKILADSIPFVFHDIHSYVDLYLNNRTNELFTVTFFPQVTDSVSFVSIYKLAYPPLQKSDLYQDNTEGRSKNWVVLAGIIALLCSLGVYFLLVNRGKRNIKENPSIDSFPKPEEEEPIISIKPVNIRVKKQSIFLFGGFQVMNREGRDITGEFTPLLKQLFLIILLNTLKDGKGISSLKLREALWFDKSEESANNNRGVSLSKLRQIFEQIGVIQIKNQNSYWLIEFDEDIYCDYYEALILMKRLKNKTTRTGKDIKKVLSIVSFGELLPNLQIDLVDPFKADFSNELIDLFLDIVQQPGLDITSQDRINLINSILIQDSLNEEALKLKCILLVNMGKNGLAKKVYDSFSKEYRLLLGTDFKHSFEQIISQ